MLLSRVAKPQCVIRPPWQTSCAQVCNLLQLLINPHWREQNLPAASKLHQLGGCPLSASLLALSPCARNDVQQRYSRVLAPSIQQQNVHRFSSAADALATASQHSEQSATNPEVFSDEDRNSRRHLRFIDRIQVSVTAGHGGKGCVSLWKSGAKGGLSLRAPT